MKILKGDCIEVMKEMPKNSVDAIVTDPPYGLEFMGKEWDKLHLNEPFSEAEQGGLGGHSHHIRYGKDSKAMQLWHTQWLTEAYRVLKPGGSMLVMGGTRTFHRLMVAIEDSGFIIKDTLMWIYGSGFPKAQDLGKMIDKRMGREQARTYFPNYKNNDYGCGLGGGETLPAEPNSDLAKHWDGFKVGGIKPAYEPIVWAVKPPEGSYIDNVLKWGVGAVNVDECRVLKSSADRTEYGVNGIKRKGGNVYGKQYGEIQFDGTKGRFPANVILDEEAGRVMDEQSGENIGKGYKPRSKTRTATQFDPSMGWNQHSMNPNNAEAPDDYGDSGGASRFFYCAKASRGERNRGLENKGQPITKHNARPCDWEKADWSKRNQNNHPTVKPIALFEYLIKLVTRKGQIVLDPFLGSGTTAIAAHKVGRECIGIEREDEYVEIAKKRIGHWEQQPQQQELRA